MLTTSWPRPSSQSPSCPASKASTTAPSAPRPTPAPSQRERPASPRVAAAMMPTNSAASSDSRKTINAVANIAAAPGLLGDHGALRRLLVVLAEEGIAAAVQRADVDG